MSEPDFKFYPVPIDKVQGVKDLIDLMEPSERSQLREHLLGQGEPAVIVIGGCSNTNNITNSIVIQSGATAGDIADQLKDIPNETLGELLRAIAKCISES